MKTNKTILAVVAFLFLEATAYAQTARVGINTTTPATTLDVSGKLNTAGTAVDPADVTGLQAPRITLTELNAKGVSLYGASQKGALVYITSATAAEITAAASNTQAPNITAIGYYYFDGSVWQKVTNGASATPEPWYNVATNTSATANTQNIYQMGRVGIGTTTPASALDIYGDIIGRDNNGSYRISAGGDFKISRNTIGGSVPWNVGTAGDNMLTILGTSGGYGYVGIGTTAPSAKLEVNNGTTAGAIKIVDGTQGAGKVLTSDANGVGTWASIGSSLNVGNPTAVPHNGTSWGPTSAAGVYFTAATSGAAGEFNNCSISPDGINWLVVYSANASGSGNILGSSVTVPKGWYIKSGTNCTSVPNLTSEFRPFQ